MRSTDLEPVFLSEGDVQYGRLLNCIVGEAERHFVVSESSLVEYPPFRS
jgi:hypothetical protein